MRTACCGRWTTSCIRPSTPGISKWKNGKFESLPTISKGQWQITQDDFGRVFKNTNDSPLFVDFTPARYFLRNPNNPRTRGLYESLIEQMDATVYPVRDNRGVNRGYRDELFRADGSSIVIQGTSGPEIYRGDKYPASMRGDAFIADSTTNLVHQMKIVDDGTGRLTAKNAWPQGEFFASSDERSRPVACLLGAGRHDVCRRHVSRRRAGRAGSGATI